MTSKTKTYIGEIQGYGAGFHASCSKCEWQRNKRASTTARDELRDHYRTRHPAPIDVYLEDETE